MAQDLLQGFRPRGRRSAAVARLIGAGLAAGVVCAAAQAATVSVSTPFINLESRKVNSLGFTPGDFLRIGAVSVTPNGNQGTTGVGLHRLPDGTEISRTINFAPSPVIPNFYSRLLTDSPELRGDWRLVFSNGSDSTSRLVSLSQDAKHAPFVNSITLSGSSQNPVFTWAPPANVTVNGYRINIYDKDLIAQGQGGQVTSRDVLPNVTSYQVTAADFTVPGFQFRLGKNYGIEISLIQTKDGSTNTSNANLQAIARVYADFRATEGDGPVVNLPVLLADGSYKFDMAVKPDVVYYIDPAVAVGYDYAIGDGNPNFASVVLPTGIGDGLYDLFSVDSLGVATLLAHDWAGGQIFNFGLGGLARFRVAGIETGAALDPSNTTAFVTGVTFTGAGLFTGTQTPITVDVDNAVPEPSVPALLVLCAAAAFWVRRGKPAA